MREDPADPLTALVFQPRTIIATYVVGIIVTMLAAWLPAHRAGRVPPVAAMRDTVETATSHPIRSAVEVSFARGSAARLAS